jgi:hypothetical protein
VERFDFEYLVILVLVYVIIVINDQCIGASMVRIERDEVVQVFETPRLSTRRFTCIVKELVLEFSSAVGRTNDTLDNFSSIGFRSVRPNADVEVTKQEIKKGLEERPLHDDKLVCVVHGEFAMSVLKRPGFIRIIAERIEFNRRYARLVQIENDVFKHLFGR